MNSIQKIVAGRKFRTFLGIAQVAVLILVAYNASLGIKTNRSILKINKEKTNEE